VGGGVLWSDNAAPGVDAGLGSGGSGAAWRRLESQRGDSIAGTSRRRLPRSDGRRRGHVAEGTRGPPPPRSADPEADSSRIWAVRPMCWPLSVSKLLLTAFGLAPDSYGTWWSRWSASSGRRIRSP